MPKRLSVFLAICLVAGTILWAQPTPASPARANVIPYYDEADILKDAYRESPYYMELAGAWKQHATDSSICYTRQLDAEDSWKDYSVYLNVRAGRAVRVSVNGKEAGYDGDSRHWNEFLLSPYLKSGRSNTLTIETMRQARAALLEDTLIPVGLNGEPYLIFKSDPNVVDYTLVADYDAPTATGTLTVSADIFCGRRKGKFYLEVEVWDPRGRSLDRMGRWVVFNGKSEESLDVSRSWSGVLPWNAEEPNLYTAVIRLRNEKMEEEETVGTRFGFRRIELKDGVMQLNGKVFTLKGIVYGLEHTEGSASRQQMQRDVIKMKQHNFNAVRTARFSPMDPYFYELCDRYGLYVVCDANLLPLSEQHKAVATDQDYMPLFERRVENLYGKYKNHTSIIAWSLGNTRDNGVCMTAAYKRLKAIEKTRPVVFSGADYGDATDVVAPCYPEKQTLGQALKKQGLRPCVMLAAVDRAHFSDFEGLWSLVKSHRQLQGGFVDVWPLGSAMLAELKHLFRPFDVKLDKLTTDDGEFIVVNRSDFAPLGDYSLDYNIFTNLRPAITGGELPVVLPPDASDRVQMRIPHVNLQAGEELFVRFSLSTRRSKMQPWQTADDLTVGSVEFALPQAQGSPKPFVNQGVAPPSTLSDTDLVRHELVFLGHTDWTVSYVDRQVRHPDANTLCIDYMLRYTAPDGNPMCDVRSTYALFSTGDVLIDYTFAPINRKQAAQLQPAVLVRHTGDSVTWFGLDREVYFEHDNSGLMGIYTGAAARLARRQVRWCAHHGDGDGLFLEVLDGQCAINSDGDHIMLTPVGTGDLRLHLRPYGQDNPADFVGFSFPHTTVGMLQPPVINVSETRFSAPLTVSFSAPQPCEIRYTLDGSEPTETSSLYSTPFSISATTTVQARAYAPNIPPSFVSRRRFIYDYIVATTFSRKPNTPYNQGADTLLFDGQRGTIDELTRGWLGFSGEPVVTTVQLAHPIDVDHVTLRYAHVPATWAFAPQQVLVTLSADGVSYHDTIAATIPFDPSAQDESEPRVVEVQIPIGRQGVGYLRIHPLTIGNIPSWHRAKGLKPWLLIDEIEVIEQ